MLNSYSYEPFGADLATSGTTSTYIKYAGGFDATGSGRLYHFGERYYDPLVGRWTQPDPLDQVGDLREGNRYVYAGGDPVNETDAGGMGLSVSFSDGISVRASFEVGDTPVRASASIFKGDTYAQGGVTVGRGRRALNVTSGVHRAGHGKGTHVQGQVTRGKRKLAEWEIPDYRIRPRRLRR